MKRFVQMTSLVTACIVSLVARPVFGDEPLTNTLATQPALTNQDLPYQPHVSIVREGNMSSTEYSEKSVEAALGDTIWIDVVDLDRWLESIKKNKNLTSDQANTSMLVLFLNGIPIKGNYPENPDSLVDTNFFDSPRNVYHLKFTLSPPTEASKDAWQVLLNRPVYEKRMSVSVGLEGGEEMDTFVTTDAKGVKTPFFLVIIPPWKGVVGFLILGGALMILLMLARKTDILRDTTGILRPDGLNAYSLARTQMAFWFFLVVTSFFLLWVVTGNMDTITNSILGLIGISAGTALSSAVIDAGKTSEDERAQIVVYMPPDKSRREIVEDLKKQQAEKEKALMDLVADRDKITSGDPLVEKASQQRINSVRNSLTLLNWQINFLTMRPWKCFMYDLLGDKDVISFHRFQIFVWTLVLGIIFVFKVYNELAMPEFSATLLGLLGISAGTFIGFKLPDQKIKD